MKCYHGSVKMGLTELKPFVSEFTNISEPVVYLTTNKQLALHYIWDMNRIGVKMPMLNIRPDGTLVFQEMFSGALEYFYKGVAGCIYHCEGDYEISKATKVPFCSISKTPVKVVGCEHIRDVYEAIMSYTEAGTFIYEKYETLPEWRIDVIRGQIVRFIKRNRLLEDTDCPSYRFVQQKFPKYLKEAEILNAHKLL